MADVTKKLGRIGRAADNAIGHPYKNIEDQEDSNIENDFPPPQPLTPTIGFAQDRARENGDVGTAAATVGVVPIVPRNRGTAMKPLPHKEFELPKREELPAREFKPVATSPVPVVAANKGAGLPKLPVPEELQGKPYRPTAAQVSDEEGRALDDAAAGAVATYDQGTNLVPEDEVAQLHKGEAVIPADQNPDNPDNSQPAAQLGGLVAPKITTGSSQMKPLGGEEPTQEAKAVAPPDPAKELADQHAQLQKEKVAAADKGDLVGLGTALLKEKELNKSAPMKAVMQTAAAPTAPPAAPAAPPSVAAGAGPQSGGVGLGADVNPNQKSGLGSAVPTAPKTPQELKSDLKALDQAILSAEAEGTPEGSIKAGHLKLEKLTLQHMNPYGSPTNHPGTLGKIEHGLAVAGNIAGDIVAPATMANIPGTQLNKERQAEGAENEVKEGEQSHLQEAQAEHEKEIAAAAAKDSKLAGQLLLKGYVLGRNAVGEPTLIQVPGFRDAPKDVKEVYSSAVASFLQENPTGDPSTDPKVQAALKALKDSQKAGQSTSEANKEKFQGVVAQLAGKFSTEPKDLDASLDSAHAAKVLSDEDYRFAKGYQATNPNAATTLNVNTEESKNKDTLKEKHKFYSYTDVDDKGNDVTVLASGDKVPDDAEKTEIKNVEQYMGEARAGNVVQNSLNQIAKDVDQHPEIWDDPALRSILATATEEMNRASAGLLIAGTGGNIPLPSGLGHMIDTYLENHASNKKGAEALRNYIADYKAMKDKALIMQMEMQGGKIGRAGAQGFLSITQQIPDGSVPNSTVASRQVSNLQMAQSGLMKKYPTSYQDYKQEKPYEPKGRAGAGGGNPHYIMYNNQKYVYSGSGPTNDIKSYTLVPSKK